MRGRLVPGRQRARLAALLGTLVLIGAGLGGCGGDDSDSGRDSAGGRDTPTRPEPKRGGQLPAGAEDFVACMRDHGVDISVADLTDGGPPPIDPQDPEVREAAFACRSQLPAGGGGP